MEVLALLFWGFVALAVYGWYQQEANMTDEEKAERRRQRREYRHRQRLAEMELEAQKKARSSAIKGQVAGTVAKVALTALLGGAARNRR